MTKEFLLSFELSKHLALLPTNVCIFVQWLLGGRETRPLKQHSSGQIHTNDTKQIFKSELELKQLLWNQLKIEYELL